jgi:hypothetical protein
MRLVQQRTAAREHGRKVAEQRQRLHEGGWRGSSELLWWFLSFQGFLIFLLC